MSDVTPHPRPAKRRIAPQDRAACRRKIEAEGRCRACGRVPSGHPLDSLTAAHLCRGAYREWHPDGVIPLCGSGTSGCHGRVDADATVRASLALTAAERAYVARVRGPAWLADHYPR